MPTILALLAAAAGAVTFEEWRNGVFPGASPWDRYDMERTGGRGDADRDGTTNLIKFAFGLGAVNHSQAGLPNYSVEGGRVTMTFTRQKDAPELQYIPQVSGDLITWTDGPAFVETVLVTDQGTTELVKVRDMVESSPTNKRRFIRLKVVPNFMDTDTDGLPDWWERNYFGGLWPVATGDDDGDGVNNLAEYQAGTVPWRQGETRGLTLERWTGVSGTSIVGLHTELGSRTPNTSAVQIGPAELAQTSPSLSNFGARLRGTVIAPITGEYTFFVSGDDDVELWLSESASRFAKERVAFHSGHNSFRNFRENASQRSRMFRFSAGQVCWLEGLQKEGGGQDHLSIGWSYRPSPAYAQAALGAVTQTWTQNTQGDMQLSVDGGDISGTADNAGFNYRTWTGDGEFVARVSAMTVPHASVKVGLMLRTSSDPGAQMVSIVQTSGDNMKFLRRATAGVSLSSTTYTGKFEWVRLRREADVVTAEASINGRIWYYVGKVTITGLPADILVGVCATDGSVSGHTAVVATVSEIQAIPFDPMEIIPEQYLSPAGADPADVNGDGLPDAWETAHGLNATTIAAGSGQFDDPDGDGWNNFEEFKRGFHPGNADSTTGFLSVQQWLDTAYYNVPELVHDTHFLSAPDVVKLNQGAEMRDLPTYSGVRARGYLTVPATGSYRFWLAGADAGELWLSTDQTKYRKRLLCGFGADDGAGNGINSQTNPHLVWDKFSAQLSEPVPLVAGQTYFIEVLGTSTHSGAGWFAVAWARDGGAREWLPEQTLKPYMGEVADADDDYLPDAWERQYGLDPDDNGLRDSARQGELGDFDRDGIMNRIEYVLGTNPASSDTDGDGVSDFDEVNFYKTSPVTSNAITQTTVGNLSLPSYNAANTAGVWQFFDGGFVSSIYRGRIEWSFSVPSDGWWMLSLDGRLRGGLRSQEELPINVQVDGQSLGRQTMNFTGGNASSLKIITPWLAAGTHSVLFDIDNDIGRRTLQIQAVRVLSNGGFDADGNGRSDWLDGILATSNSLAPGASESAVSPAFIEGAVRHTGGVAVTAAGAPAVAQRGLGDQHWFSNVPLQPDGATPVSVQFENGGITQNRAITWVRWNSLGGSNVTIRAGDTLKIGAWISTEDTGTSTITVAGQTHPGVAAAGGYFLQAFTEPGTFAISTTHSTGPVVNATISVVAASFGQQQAFYADWATWRTFSGVPTALWVDSEPSLVIPARTAASGGQSLQLLASRSGPHVLAARISAGGPIVGLGTVDSVGISDTLRNDAAQYVGSTADGYRILRSPIMVSELPAGGRVVVTIFRAGVTFLDGTTVVTLTAADFVEGVAYLDFRYPATLGGGYCHYIDVYDGQNRLLGRH